VLFQPILDVITGAELGFEALTRLALAPELEFPRELLMEARRLGRLRWLNEHLAGLAMREFMIALDDFGEGFASLTLWSELHPRFVKTDRHFVTGIDRNFMREQFVEAFQRVASRCGVSLIAEGVENARELAAVRRLGIRYAQGFLLGRPAPGSIWHSQPLRLPGWALEGAPVARAGRRPPRTLEKLVRRIEPADVSLADERVHDERAGTCEIAAAAVTAKQSAKRTAGSCLFLERRGPFSAVMPRGSEEPTQLRATPRASAQPAELPTLGGGGR
jgi:EAL domain-containing protein (putative c-di-GMP-specific phosphodiesterase class I)